VKTKELSAQSLTIISKVGFQTMFFISTLHKREEIFSRKKVPFLKSAKLNERKKIRFYSVLKNDLI